MRREASDASDKVCFSAVTLMRLEYCDVMKRAKQF